MLEELQVPYALKLYQRDPGGLLAPPELKEIHPRWKAPAITDGELTLAEFGSIIEYLQETYDAQGLFKPTAHYDCQQFRYLMHYAEGSLMRLLIMKLIFSRLGR